MKGKAVIPLALGLCIGLVAVKFVFDTLKKAQASGGNATTITAVRAKQDIDAYSKITKEMVEEIKTADSAFLPSKDRFEKISDVVDRVSAKSIPQGSALLSTMIAPVGTSSGMEGRIPEGYRAVAVKIDEVTGVAYQVKPGDMVDVIVVMDLETGDRRRTKETFAEVILQNVEVAAIGQSTASAGEGGDASKVKPAKSATLLIHESEVTKLHLAATRGKLTLSMRGKDATTNASPVSAHSADLLKSTKKLLPEPVATTVQVAQVVTPTRAAFEQMEQQEPPFGVTVYRRSATGSPTQIERITFENSRSSKIVDVQDRATGRTAALMRGASSPHPAPGTIGTRTASPERHEAPSESPTERPTEGPLEEDTERTE